MTVSETVQSSTEVPIIPEEPKLIALGFTHFRSHGFFLVSDTTLLVNWALQFLEEKKHRVGEEHLDKDRVLVIPIDGQDMIVTDAGDIVNLASGYDDWPERYAQYGEWIQEHMGK